LHTAALPGDPVPIRDLSPRSGNQLEKSIQERGRPWRGGPYSEVARALVSEHPSGLLAALAAEALDCGPEISRAFRPVLALVAEKIR
jgi:hypothetical protein